MVKFNEYGEIVFIGSKDSLIKYSGYPKYMIPSRFEKVDVLPRNTNGKIDILQLKNMANG